MFCLVAQSLIRLLRSFEFLRGSRLRFRWTLLCIGEFPYGSPSGLYTNEHFEVLCVQHESLGSDREMREGGVKVSMQGTTDVHGKADPIHPTLSHEFSYSKLVNSDLIKNKHMNLMWGLEDLLLNGPYMIWNVSITLKKWSPDANLIREDLIKVLVCVKLHNVLMVAFTSDGLSIIATKLGNPIMLNSYTSSMCMESWGPGSFARAMIELDAT
ncbi:zinc knuckle CX2CX4HX4C containing protein [Tanacetum coccineum]